MVIKGKHANGTLQNIDMEILENPMDWFKKFQDGWMAHLERTGEFNWSQYARPRNLLAPSGPGITLSESRILLISSAGSYLPATQNQFKENDPTGDYSLRLIPSNTGFEDIAFAHTHYDHQYVNADPQVLLPLRHLESLAAQGFIGEVAPFMISYNGYQPNVLRVVKELIPDILDIAKQYQVRGALLVPA